MICSIIVPVYYNEGSLKKTFQLVKNQMEISEFISGFEFVFIDDGSGDNSYNELLAIKNENTTDNITIIKFSRNFGQVPAILAGYKHAKGDCILNISADLQDPPELIGEMISTMKTENKEIVICNRVGREENWYRKITSGLFYWIIKKLLFKNMPLGGFDFTLISKKVKNEVLANNEANPFWQGQILWTGFSIKFIPYKRLKREIGKSRWTFSKKIKYLIDGVLAYSYLPLRFMSILGIVLFILGLIYALFIVIRFFIGEVPFKGWAPIMILILVLSGLQMLMIGVIGEYLWRTLDQVRNRPKYIIEKVE